jgi:hypothetical protein
MSITHPKVFDTAAGKFRELSTADLGGNIGNEFREAFEVYVPNTGGRWVEVKGSGDLVFADGNAAAASYLVISKSPLLQGTETVIELDPAWHFRMSAEIAFGASMSQRTLGQEFAIEVVDTSEPLADVPQLVILSITQVGTTLTVQTAQPHNLSVGKSIGCRAVPDSRINYPSLVVSAVPAPDVFQCTAGPGGTIPSLSSYCSAVLAATAAVALPANTYANGTAGVGATLTATANGAFPTVDGVTIPLGGRVLVKDEAAQANNGIYVLTQVGNAGVPWILTRAADFDTAAEMTVVAGVRFAVAVYVQQGTGTRAGSVWSLNATVTTVGTTAVTFTVTDLPRPALGYVYFRERFGRSRNGVSQIFENATVTNASLYIRSEAGDALPSGTIAGNHSVTVGTTASVQLVNSPNQYAFAATTEFKLVVQSDRTQWIDAPVDSSAQSNNRLPRTQVCPDPAERYKLRVRATNNAALTVPIGLVVNAIKTGTTTAEIELDRDHDLEVGDLMLSYGMRAQGATEFPNVAAVTPVLAVIDNRRFTMAIGTAGTITSRGGFVARAHGGNLMTSLGVFSAAAQSAVLSTLVDGTRQLVLTGSGNWGGTIGALAELVGCVDAATGATLGLDGPWKIANTATTTLTLVLPFADQRTLPSDFGSTNCGGAIIPRTDLRLSFVRLLCFLRHRVESRSLPANDASSAWPVSVQGGGLSAAQSGNWTMAAAGTAAADAAVPNPLVAGVAARNVNAAPVGATARAQHWVGTMLGVGITKSFSIPEADWQTPVSITNSATAVPVREAAAAGNRNYVTSIDLISDALTNATELRLREQDLSANSQTIASNTLVLSATHNLAVGDAMVASASTVTGLTAGVMYYVQSTPAAASITLSATRGGAVLAISGTGVTATLHKVLWQTRIPTSGRPAGQLTFSTPLRATVTAPVLLQTVTASGAGTVSANVQGYVAP